jgi:endo-1,4-beta-D-glucanase Y
LWCCTLAQAAVTPAAPDQGAFQTGQYRNLFAQIGKTPAAIQAKVDAAWATYFGNTHSSKALYWTRGDDEAYILNPQENDVRSEGMSYGMMIAVQLDKPEPFDRLWRFAKRHMLHKTGDHAGYLCWKADSSGHCLDAGAAPDGEAYIAMALLFAHHRWGVATYRQDALTLLTHMLHKKPSGLVQPMFNLKERQIVFSTVGGGATFTDPSYHLPAFWHLFSLWGPAQDRLLWQSIRDTSRDFFLRASDPKTCLSPEYAHFDGQPHFGYNWATNVYDQPEQKQSRNDAFRVVFNWSIDHAWFAADARQSELSNCLLAFYHQRERGGGITANAQGVYSPQHWQYNNLDGTLDAPGLPNLNPATGGTNWKAWSGLMAMNATGALAASTDTNWPLDFVHLLWSAPLPLEKYRYYDGLLYTLGTLAAAGQYRIHLPPPVPAGVARPVQLEERLVLMPGQTYVLRFDARAAGGPASQVLTMALKSGADGQQTVAQAGVRLTRILQRHSISFTLANVSNAPDNTSPRQFWLSADTQGVELDNLVLQAP